MTTKKQITLTIADFEHICASLNNEGDKFYGMARDPEYAKSIAGEGMATPENLEIWRNHAAYLNDLHYTIKEQLDLPR